MNQNSEQFQKLFSGLKRGYGILENGDYHYVKGQPTTELFQQHLEGKSSLGIVPITDDNTCKVGALDIDTHKKDKSNMTFKKFNNLYL